MSSIFQPEILRFRTSRNQYHQVFVNVKHASLKYYCLHILTHTATFCFLNRSILSGTGRGVFSAASLFWWRLPHTYAEVAFGKFFLKYRLNLLELTLQKKKKILLMWVCFFLSKSGAVMGWSTATAKREKGLTAWMLTVWGSRLAYLL